MNIIKEVDALRAKGQTIAKACRTLKIKPYAYTNRKFRPKGARRAKVTPVVARLPKGEIVYVMNRKTAVQLIKDLGI